MTICVAASQTSKPPCDAALRRSTSLADAGTAGRDVHASGDAAAGTQLGAAASPRLRGRSPGRRAFLVAGEVR